MSKFKIAFFMMAAMICMAATSWGDSISLNNNNDFIVANGGDDPFNEGIITFEMGKINTGTVSPEFFHESKVTESGWGYFPTISLNDNGTFVEANLGAGSNKIYYNAGKIDPITHEIKFTDTGLSFTNNDGSAPSIYLDNNNNFIEVHMGEGDHRIVKTNKFPYFKIVPIDNLYYVTGKIDNDGKLKYLNTGKYCGYGETPIITTTDDNIFTEIHAGPDSGSPYSIIGNIGSEGDFLSRSGEGQIVAIDGRSQLKNQCPLAVKMTRIKGTEDYNVNLLTGGAIGYFSDEGYLHILNGALPNDGPIVWNSCVDIPVPASAYAAANDKYFICYISAPDSNYYKVIPYNASGN